MWELIKYGLHATKTVIMTAGILAGTFSTAASAAVFICRLISLLSTQSVRNNKPPAAGVLILKLNPRAGNA